MPLLLCRCSPPRAAPDEGASFYLAAIRQAQSSRCQKAPMLLLEQVKCRIFAEREYIGLQVGVEPPQSLPMDLLVLLCERRSECGGACKEDLTPLLKFSSASEHETAQTGTDAAEAAQQGSGGESIVLDSLQRARRVLALLKVPFSILEEGVNKERDVAGAEEGDESQDPSPTCSAPQPSTSSPPLVSGSR